MPVIKSAKKQARQNIKRRARNYPYRSELKSAVKKALQFAKDGKKEELVKFLPHVYSVIDTACKKNLVHPNNAARKKSRIARALNALEQGGGASKTEAAPKVAKKEEKKEEAAPAETPAEKEEA